MQATRQPAAGIRMARWAVLAIFFVNGAIWATWAAYIPFIKAKFNLGEATLGLLLLVAAAGSVVSLSMVGGWIARAGSRLVTSISTLAFCLALPLLIGVPALPLLVAALALFGLSNGAMDVAMNAQAVAVEERNGRPIMSTFHALFSTGGLAGAAIAGLLISAGVEPQSHALAVAAVLGTVAVVALRHLLPASVDQVSDAPIFVRPSGSLLGLGVLAFFCMVSEGAMADWSAVYLDTSLGAGQAFAALGYAAFSLAMAIGRFAGDALKERFKSVRLVRYSGAVAAVGLGIGLLVEHPVVALAGFASVGLGLANIIPVLFSAAGRRPGVATGMGVAAVATAGYFGFLTGPPLIGFVSQLTSLRIGLGLVVLFAAIIALRARTVDR